MKTEIVGTYVFEIVFKGLQQALDDVSFSNGFKENPQKDFLASSDIKLTTRWGPIFAFLSHATVTLSSFGAPNCSDQGNIGSVLKSSQSKDYGIGHNKNFNKLLKSVVNAKKHPEIGCMC